MHLVLIRFLLLTLSGIAGGLIAGAIKDNLSPASVIASALSSAAVALAVIYVRFRRQRKSQDA
ncbi:hypothetical protein ABZ851_30655 [Streptomyces sp. NPDC047049]|uniref:hypothetical protein n=1 Tax=Streptomyces sp. NPDC047049 TaxID=3156688 RepID=UPI0033F574FB